VEATDLRDPLFRVHTAPAFERASIADLAYGRHAAIIVPQSLPADRCARIMSALEAVQFEKYGARRVVPAVFRFGVGISDFRRDGRLLDEYWDAVAASRAAWDALRLPFDPFGLCRDALAAAWPGGVAVARRSGRELAAGVAREPNDGFLVHFDDAAREFHENLLDEPLVAQFAFNLYISVPEHGGHTVVWRHRWQPQDEDLRRPDSYGYDEAVVADTESLTLQPQVGQAMLFDPRNFHAVRPSRGARRVALGFQVGLTDTGRLLTWG
jgi:hypothetical protein